MRCVIISSCQSAATSEIVKRSWAWQHRGAALYQVPNLYLFFVISSVSFCTPAAQLMESCGARGDNVAVNDCGIWLRQTVWLQVIRLTWPTLTWQVLAMLCSNMQIFVTAATAVGRSQVWITSWNWLIPKIPVWYKNLGRISYNRGRVIANFCVQMPKFSLSQQQLSFKVVSERPCWQQGRSETTLNDIIKLTDPEKPLW